MSVAVDVETRRYRPFSGAGDYFWQSYEENQVRLKIHHTIRHTNFRNELFLKIV